MSTGDKGPHRLLRCTFRHIVALQLLILLMQIGVYAANTHFFPRHRLLPLIPLFEAALPYLLIPLFRYIRRELVPEPVPEDLLILGEFMTAVGLITLTVLILLQILNWIYPHELHGGPFYFAALLMAGIWGFRPLRSKPPLHR